MTVVGGVFAHWIGPGCKSCLCSLSDVRISLREINGDFFVMPGTLATLITSVFRRIPHRGVSAQMPIINSFRRPRQRSRLLCHEGDEGQDQDQV